MTRLLWVLLLLASAGTASAMNIPDATHSHVDPVLVGNVSGADMGNSFHVNVRNGGNEVLPGISVSVVFFAGGAHPLSQQEPGTTVTCASPASIVRITDSNGDVFFHARIAGFVDVRDADHTVQVRGNGVLLSTILVRSTDLNGDGIMDLADLDLFRQQFLADPGPGHADFNHDGVVDLTDLNLFRAEYMTRAGGTVCP